MFTELAIGQDSIGAGALGLAEEKGKAKGVWTIEVFRARKDGQIDRRRKPIQRFVQENLLINVGIQAMQDKLIGAGAAVVFDNTHAFIGAGDSTTAAAATQTDLQAATNKFYQGMDATFPSRSAQTVTWRATFASGSANYHWQEVGLFNGNNPPTALMFSRIVNDYGTKNSSLVYVISYVYSQS
jgi:hypothetical protein